jgi:hypothetical protein
MDVAVGPEVGLVVASMVNRLPEVNEPNAETSMLTVRGAPGPLLSVGMFTAWLATMITTLPSAFRTGKISRSALSVSV